MKVKKKLSDFDKEIMSRAVDFMAKYGATGIQVGSKTFTKTKKGKLKVESK